MKLSSSRATTAALAFAIATLQACGGGGDSGSPSPAPTPAPAPSGDYLRIGVVSADASDSKTLVFFDTDTPAVSRLSLRLTGSDSVTTARLFAMNGAQQTVTLVGESAAYVIQGSLLYRVSLKKSDATVAQRVSTLVSVCSLSTYFQNPDETGWLAVTEGGPDQNCFSTADNRVAYVRPDASATTEPLYLPAGVTLVEVLPDENWAQAQYLLALDSRGPATKLTLYRPDLTPAGDVAGGEVADATLLHAGLTPGQAWLRANSQLRALTWNSSGATLAATNAYTFTTSTTVHARDGSAIYIAEGLNIVRVPQGGSGQVIATLAAGLGASVELEGVYGDKLLISQVNGTGVRTLQTLPKAGGSPLTIATASNSLVYGVSGSTVYYASFGNGLVGGVSVVQSHIQRVNLDGTQAGTVAAQAHYAPDPIYPSALSVTSGLALDGLVWCERATGEATCANGTLKMLNSKTGATTSLGNFTHADAYSWWSTYDYSTHFSYLTLDTPLVLLTRSTRQGTGLGENEVYTAQPGVAGTLTKVNIAP